MKTASKGVTLVETIVFITIISIALTVLVRVYTQTLIDNVSIEPLIRIRALSLAQAQMDEILARKFDQNTPPGGVPACNSTGGATCLGVSPNSAFDDVGDYHGQTFNVSPYRLDVTVVNAGTDLGLAANQAKLVSIVVTMPDGDQLNLASYATNF